MKTIKLIIFIGIFFTAFSAFSQEIDNNCDIENYVFVDSLMIKENLIDERTFSLYAKEHQKLTMLIKSKEEYLLFKSIDAKDIDFEKYNVFVGFYSVCSPVVLQFSLLFDQLNNQHIISIVQFTHLPYLKIGCPSYLVTVIIPKKYCDKICYTQKIIKNEN